MNQKQGITTEQAVIIIVILVVAIGAAVDFAITTSSSISPQTTSTTSTTISASTRASATTTSSSSSSSSASSSTKSSTTTSTSTSARVGFIHSGDTFGQQIIFLANSLHQYGRDSYGLVSTPYVVDLDVMTGKPLYWTGYSLYADQAYLQAFEVSGNATYLHWAQELLDWEWSHEVVNGLLADYDASVDQIIPATDTVVDASFISTNLEMYFITNNGTYFGRAGVLTNGFWSHAVNASTKVPYILVNPTTLQNAGPLNYWYDFNKWIYPPLAMVAQITENQTYKSNLWTMTQSLYGTGTINPKTGLAPTGILHGSPLNDVQFFRAAQGAYGLMVAGDVLGDARYTQIGLEQISLMDKYMWVGYYPNTYYNHFSDSYKHWFSDIDTNGNVLNDHVSIMDADGLVGFLKSYQLTGNQTLKSHIYAFVSLLNQTQWDNYPRIGMIPDKVELNGAGQKLADDTRIFFPDTVISAYTYGYQLTNDPYFLNLLNSVGRNLNYYHAQYGIGCEYDAPHANVDTCPRYYEHQFYEYPSLYLMLTYSNFTGTLTKSSTFSWSSDLYLSVLQP